VYKYRVRLSYHLLARDAPPLTSFGTRTPLASLAQAYGLRPARPPLRRSAPGPPPPFQGLTALNINPLHPRPDAPAR